MSNAPLEGLRILSLAEQFPGPYATMLLSDIGAEVIMVERPGMGDPARPQRRLRALSTKSFGGIFGGIASNGGEEKELKSIF